MGNIYNLDYLKEISGDDTFIKDMISTFVKDAPQYYYKLKRHFIHRNYAGMEDVIHKFKNAATYIGNNQLLKELSDLDENISGSKNTLKIRSNIIQIDLLVHDIITKLKTDFNIL